MQIILKLKFLLDDRREQMGAWKEAVSQMSKVDSGEMGGLQSAQSPQPHPTSHPPIVADKIGQPEQPRQGHRKIAWPSPAGTPSVEISQDEKPEELRETDWKGAYLSNLLAGYRRGGKYVATIEQKEAIGVVDSLHRRRKATA